MKKGLKYIVAGCLFITGLGFVSCDNEKVDPLLEGNTMVGRPIVNLNIAGENYMERDKIVATVDKNREFTLRVDNLGETGEDYLIVNIKKFIEGNFPTNVNESTYYSKKDDTEYTTKDILRPNWVTGIISMSYINKNARVVNGGIDIKSMIPLKSDNPNLKPFPITGDFSNIPYSRLEKTYFDAFVSDEPMQNSKEKIAIEDNSLIISGTDEVGKTQSLFITFAKGLVLKSNTKYEQDTFKAVYTSPEGVKYVSLEENRKDSYLIVENVENAENTTQDLKKPLKLKGTFDLVLFKEDDNNVSIKITEGEFSFKQEEIEAKTK